MAAAQASATRMTGAEMIMRALVEQGVDVIFGYPGGAVLPIYDALFKQNSIRHILVRQEGGAVHAAEGYARSTGKVGVVLVTSGPGATNAVTGLADALMDSVPIVCLTGQVPTHLIGNDAFQECDTTGITRACTKHNYLVKDVNRLAPVLHEAFLVARSGRPGPVVVDIPKDLQFAEGDYAARDTVALKNYKPQLKGDPARIKEAVKMLAAAKRPLFYIGGGCINSGPEACKRVTKLVRMTGYPATMTLMGLGALPGEDPQSLGLVGMHGTYESNLAMHGCDLMVAVASRFDDRVTGRLDAFSPGSKKIHIDIDPSSINKSVTVDLPIIGDVGEVVGDILKEWTRTKSKPDAKALAKWWEQIATWRAVDCLRYKKSDTIIKPQFALERLREAVRGRETYISTDIGQHQMWAAQLLKFEEPRRWLTSGGLGTMGYGLPAAVGAQIAHPKALAICVTGEASILMNIQEMATASQYRLPVKVFILNNQYMGMVRQWQELLHGGRYSESYSSAIPDFVKLAEAFGGVGMRVEKPSELDRTIREMIECPKSVIVDVLVAKDENCFPMIPGGKAHNEILLAPPQKEEQKVSEDGMVLV